MEGDFHYFLRSRRSIRHFSSSPVSIDIIQRILETAIFAPSAHNLQPWRFVVLIDNIDKLRLAEALASKFQQDMINDGIPESENRVQVTKTLRRIGEAPVIIVLCRDRKSVKPQPDAARKNAEMLMGVQSIAAAGLQLLLAAHAEGLGGCWICWPLFAPRETIRALELPADWEPQSMIFLGYPIETPGIPARASLKEITKFL